jgi:GlcNAc-P-P-Und epimerase
MTTKIATGWRKLETMKILCTGGSGFIGTHLIDNFLAKGMEFLNIDIVKPKKQSHNAYWQECNILDLDRLQKIFKEFQPSHVIHLAARATMEGKSLDDFRDNTIGTANVLDAVKHTPSISRVIITSSQHVRKPGSGIPQRDDDFKPLGLYGESKVITEQLTRRADLNSTWTIIRPTMIWGPFHPFLATGALRMIKKGIYFHPRGEPVIRSYGYVKNSIWQIEKIMLAQDCVVDKKTFYVGEIPSNQLDWLNAFSSALTGKNVRVVPRFFIYSLAKIGDILFLFGIKFPMYSERFRNLTTSNPVPVQSTIDAFGQPPYSLQVGISETISWLRDQGGIWNQ